MYTVDDYDTVTEVSEAPQSSVGAPCPMLLVGEHELFLVYFVESEPEDWDGSTIRIVDESTNGEPCALITFKRPYAHMFGPPNDEAFSGHPLYARGLRPYGVFEISRSSWIRQLERMNSVHPYHCPEHFAKYRHFVFAFHDRTLECIAEDFVVKIQTGSVRDILHHIYDNRLS